MYMKTVIAHDVGQRKDWYMSNIPITGEAAMSIRTIQQMLGDQLGSQLWVQPQESLHVTLFDFIAPKVEYDTPHKKLFDALAGDIDEVMSQLAHEFKQFELQLTLLKFSAGAIYLEGYDDGSIASIRKRFLELFALDAKTKRPPQIIHSTIARFTDSIDIDNIQATVERQVDQIIIPVRSLRLVHEQRIPMLQYETLKEYLLQ